VTSQSASSLSLVC